MLESLAAVKVCLLWQRLSQLDDLFHPPTMLAFKSWWERRAPLSICGQTRSVPASLETHLDRTHDKLWQGACNCAVAQACMLRQLGGPLRLQSVCKTSHHAAHHAHSDGRGSHSGGPSGGRPHVGQVPLPAAVVARPVQRIVRRPRPVGWGVDVFRLGARHGCGRAGYR